MPSLRELQEDVRRSILRGEHGVAASYVVGDGISPEQRLGLYHNTFVETLTGALRLSFPAVLSLVGEDFFAGAAYAYVHQQVPSSACLNEYGESFPEFLASFPAAASLPYLHGVARLEWAANRALHAPDVEPLDIAGLAAIAPADECRLCFVPHPSVSVVRDSHPVDAIWRAVLDRDDSALAAIDLAAGPVSLIVQRLPAGVEVARIDEAASRFVAALVSGEPLAAALEIAAGIDAPALLAQQLASGRFIGFTLRPASGDTGVQELRS